MPRDVFTLLEADHRQAKRTLERLPESEGGELRRRVDELTAALTVHMDFEEQRVYPALGGCEAEARVEATTEHRLARQALAKVNELAGESGFGAAVEMLASVIGHHVEEEESEVFPELRRVLGKERAAELATALMSAKQRAGLQPPDDASADELRAAAAASGVDGTSRMSKQELREALSR